MHVICVYQPTQVLSMSRLGGAAAVAPLVADMSSEVTLPQALSLPLALQSIKWQGMQLLPLSLAFSQPPILFFYSSTLEVQDVYELTHQLTPHHTHRLTHTLSMQARSTPIYEDVVHGSEVSEIIRFDT
jgi:hypothetical protein